MLTCPFTPCRLVFKGMSLSRPNAVIGKCRMIRHSRDKKNEPNPQRCVLLSFTSLFRIEEGVGCRNQALETSISRPERGAGKGSVHGAGESRR